MNEYIVIWLWLVLRLMFAIGLISLGWRFLISAPENLHAIPNLFYGMGCFVLSGVIIAPSIAKLLAHPSGHLYYPARRTGKPSPVYSIPESLRRKGLYQESLEAYRKLLIQHPQEVKAYLALIEIAFQELHDPRLALSSLNDGLATLKDESNSAYLLKMYKTYEAASKRIK